MIRLRRQEEDRRGDREIAGVDRWVWIALLVGVMIGAWLSPRVEAMVHLQPGEGFNGPLPAFSPVGEGDYAALPANVGWVGSAEIDARGDVTLWLTADHPSGVRAVAVSLNGGPWGVQPVRVDESGAMAAVTFRPRAVGGAWATLRAVALPHAGVPAAARELT
ncbi:MAG: hypothetical protein AAF078_05400, partial [Planctomycetota bacterium]